MTMSTSLSSAKPTACVGQEDLPVEAVRRLVGPDMIIGLSTHSPDQARAAVASGADYIGVGPIYRRRPKRTFAPL